MKKIKASVLNLKTIRKQNKILLNFWSPFLRNYDCPQSSAFLMNGLMILTVLLGDPSKISLTNLNVMTVVFVVLFVLGTVQNTGDAMQISMISDVTDYGTARSGAYVPGLIGTIFSFVDNFFSSFTNSIVGFVVAMAGYSLCLP